MSIEISLASKAAVVTGAGRGIGRAISQKLAEGGASVLLVDIDTAALAETHALIQKTGGTCEALAGDLTDPAFPGRVVRKMVDTWRAIDIIVNNAGYTWDSVIQKTSDEQFQAMFDIHVVAPFRLLRSASEWIRSTAKKEITEGQRITRKVVNITSITGIDGNAGQVAYSSGKAAVIGLTKTMAKEWSRYNVTVNAVGFGLIETRLTKPMDDPDTEVSIGEKQVHVGIQPETREQIQKAIPLGRFGTPEDAANAVLFFCSPLSDYVTGEVLVCGGGVHF